PSWAGLPEKLRASHRLANAVHVSAPPQDSTRPPLSPRIAEPSVVRRRLPPVTGPASSRPAGHLEPRPAPLDRHHVIRIQPVRAPALHAPIAVALEHGLPPPFVLGVVPARASSATPRVVRLRMGRTVAAREGADLGTARPA